MSIIDLIFLILITVLICGAIGSVLVAVGLWLIYKKW